MDSFKNPWPVFFYKDIRKRKLLLYLQSKHAKFAVCRTQKKGLEEILFSKPVFFC